MGKGSTRRKMQVSQEQWERNWKQAFGQSMARETKDDFLGYEDVTGLPIYGKWAVLKPIPPENPIPPMSPCQCPECRWKHPL